MRRYRTDDETEELAQKIRQKFGLSATGELDVFGLIGQISDARSGFRLEIVPDNSLQGNEAYADPKANKIVAAESTISGAKRGIPRFRMTLAHEVAHMLLHDGINFRGQTSDIRSRNNSKARMEESEAKRLAGHLLVPTEGAAACKSAMEICERFGVSFEAARVRFDQIAAKERRKIGTHRRLPDSVVQFLTNARKNGDRITSLDIHNLAIAANPPTPEAKYSPNEIAKPPTNIAKIQGYDLEVCPDCRNQTLTPDGSCLTCRTCGGTGRRP